jgi:hypothetical protein
VHIPLPEHADRSLLRHPKCRSRTINGGSAMKVVHRADGFGIVVSPVDVPLICGLV